MGADAGATARGRAGGRGTLDRNWRGEDCRASASSPRPPICVAFLAFSVMPRRHRPWPGRSRGPRLVVDAIRHDLYLESSMLVCISTPGVRIPHFVGELPSVDERYRRTAVGIDEKRSDSELLYGTAGPIGPAVLQSALFDSPYISCTPTGPNPRYRRSAPSHCLRCR